MHSKLLLATVCLMSVSLYSRPIYAYQDNSRQDISKILEGYRIGSNVIKIACSDSQKRSCRTMYDNGVALCEKNADSTAQANCKSNLGDRVRACYAACE